MLVATDDIARVLSRPRGADNDYGSNPYEDYERLGPFFPSGPRDDRLDPMDRVVGIGAPDAEPWPSPSRTCATSGSSR